MSFNKIITPEFSSGFADVNGLKMYYEIHGTGKPLVLIHGGGSSIHVTFSQLIPHLDQHYKVIAMDLQAHGRTGDRPAELSFEQDAADIAALLSQLHIEKADVIGYSNGGQTAVALALQNPELINKLVICSSFYKRSGAFPQFFDGFDHVNLAHMPQQLKDAYIALGNSEAALQNMFDRDVNRMKNFRGWTDDQIRSIQTPTLVMSGDQDVGTAEHAVEFFRTLQNAQLIILPGTHGTYIGELNPAMPNNILPEITAKLIRRFLEE